MTLAVALATATLAGVTVRATPGDAKLYREVEAEVEAAQSNLTQIRSARERGLATEAALLNAELLDALRRTQRDLVKAKILLGAKGASLSDPVEIP